jgi:acyl-CoA hydrolase
MKAKNPFELIDHVLISPSDLNSDWSMHGGRLFYLMDLKAAIVARNHSGFICHTVSGSSFKYFLPVNTSHELIIHAKITKAWNSSMEIKTQAFRKALGQDSELAMSIYLYFVAIENGAPQEVCPVLPQTAEEKLEYSLADRRREEVKRFIDEYIENLDN